MVAKANLKKFLESAIINTEDMDECLNRFLDQYKSWSRKQGRMRVDKKQIMEFRLTMEELLRKLRKDNPPVKTGKRGIENEGESSLSRSVKEPLTPKTPQQVLTKKIKFAKLSPKLDLFKTFDCHICPKRFDWLKSLS